VSFLVFFYVRDTAATRGQYLALSKAWRSCLLVRIRMGTGTCAYGNGWKRGQNVGPSANCYS